METSPLPFSAADPSPSLYNSQYNMHKTLIKKIKIITSRTFLYNQLTNVKTEREREREGGGGGGWGGGEKEETPKTQAPASVFQKKKTKPTKNFS